MAGWGGPGRGGGDRGELHHSRLVSPKSRRRAFAQPGTQPRHGARAGRGGGRHSGRAILTGPAAPGSGARSGARRKHSRRASSLGRASHGRRQRALGVGAEPLPRVSGGWGLAASGVVVEGGANFAGNLRGSGAARARTVETDAGHPRLYRQFPVRGVRGQGDEDPREPDRCCGLGGKGGEERQSWETDWPRARGKDAGGEPKAFVPRVAESPSLRLSRWPGQAGHSPRTRESGLPGPTVAGGSRWGQGTGQGPGPRTEVGFNQSAGSWKGHRARRAERRL